MLKRLKNYWRRGFWHRLAALLAAGLLLATGTMYGVAEWYIHSQRSKPLEMGVSFIPAYAESLGLDPQATMDGLLDIGVRHFRLVSYWNQHEPAPDRYDFSLLDWQFKKAEARHAKILLTVGLRQPRWPECHQPAWLDMNNPKDPWQKHLYDYMMAVVERYKTSPALEKYQLENEYFLKGFGLCTDYDRGRLVTEYDLLKKLDPKHPVVVGRSNNAIGFPTGQPQPDEFSISVYKRVWDAGVTHRYLEYPWPAWYYGWLAGFQKLFMGRDMMIGELQAEAWAPNLKRVTEVSLNEQNKSLDAKRLEGRFKYAQATGMREIYMWGAEYWYYRLVVLNDPSLWQVARQEFKASDH